MSWIAEANSRDNEATKVSPDEKGGKEMRRKN